MAMKEGKESPDGRDAYLRQPSLKDTKVFIAWSDETKLVAEQIFKSFCAAGLFPWLSDQIRPGREFRNEIRDRILNTNVVVAVLPEEPSRWLTAEAGLAYFEQKLIPVVVDSKTTVEPFSELQVHTITRQDATTGEGDTIDELIDYVKDTLGQASSESRWIKFFRHCNSLFPIVTPSVGFIIVFGLLTTGILGPLGFWKSGHVVLGTMVAGGGAFVALLYALAGKSTNFTERQFGIRVASRLSVIWFLVAGAQLIVGSVLVWQSHFLITHDWVLWSVFAYIAALALWAFGFYNYTRANENDKRNAPQKHSVCYKFAANACFGLGLILITLVIILMSLKASLTELL